MPPSGYTTSQSHSVTNFLTSCAEALRQEAVQSNLTPIQALTKECANIRQILDSVTQPTIQASVLHLTLTFYENVLRSEPSNFVEYDMSVGQEASSVTESILAIHVPSA